MRRKSKIDRQKELTLVQQARRDVLTGEFFVNLHRLYQNLLAVKPEISKQWGKPKEKKGNETNTQD